jgi:hypothetical protein
MTVAVKEQDRTIVQEQKNYLRKPGLLSKWLKTCCGMDATPDAAGKIFLPAVDVCTSPPARAKTFREPGVAIITAHFGPISPFKIFLAAGCECRGRHFIVVRPAEAFL